MSGSNNISLQQWTKDSTVPTSLTFSGNNTNYTGTLHLHPAINYITFTYPNSVIRNINFPNSIPNTGGDKDTVPFIKSNKPRTLTISILFNTNNSFDCIDKLTIPSNTILCLNNANNDTEKRTLSNLSKSKPLNIFFNSKTEQSSNLKILNINNNEYVPVEYIEQTFFIPDDNIIAARFDYNTGENGICLYYYPKKIRCCSCGELISLKTIKPTKELLSNENIIQYLELNICNSCGNTINPTLVSYLYPKYTNKDLTFCNVFCSICGDILDNDKWIGWCDIIFDNMNKIFTNINGDSSFYEIEDHNNCPQIPDNNNIIYDANYVLEQLNTGKVPIL